MAMTRRGRAKPMSREARREQLLAAAARAFERGGYYGTHVRDVIREAGVARGTFYLYFRSKHEVFEALVERMLAVFLDVRPPGIEGDVATVADAERVLRRSLHTVLEAFHRHRGLCRLLFEEAVGLEKGFAQRLASHIEVWHERIAATRRHFVERGIFRKDYDVERTSELVVGMVLHLTRTHLFVERAPDFDRMVDAIVELELRGALPR